MFGAGFPDAEIISDTFSPSLREMSEGGFSLNRGGAVG